MDLPGWALELVKYGGLPVLMFLMWFIYHRSTDARWTAAMNSMDRQRQQDFELLKNTIQTVEMHTAILARVENKIDSGAGCRIDVIRKTAKELARSEQ